MLKDAEKESKVHCTYLLCVTFAAKTKAQGICITGERGKERCLVFYVKYAIGKVNDRREIQTHFSLFTLNSPCSVVAVCEEREKKAK